MKKYVMPSTDIVLMPAKALMVDAASPAGEKPQIDDLGGMPTPSAPGRRLTYAD